MSQLVAIQINEGDFTKEEHEGTAILVENDTVERVLTNALKDSYVTSYVIKIFDQKGKIMYYRITENK